MTTETSIFTTLYGPKFIDQLSNRDAYLVSCLHQDLSNTFKIEGGAGVSFDKDPNANHLTIYIRPLICGEYEDAFAFFYPVTAQMLRGQDRVVIEFIKTYLDANDRATEYTHYGYETTIGNVEVEILVII